MRDQPLWTTRDVAAYLRCTPRYAAKLCRDGRIRARKVGPTWRTTRGNVDEFIGLVGSWKGKG